MTGPHEHPQPVLPQFDNRPYGQPGHSDPAPVAGLLAAAADDCAECYRAQVQAVAADPMLSAHLAACAYTVLKGRSARTGVPVPPVAELAVTYVSTLASAFAAFSLDGFEYALMFVREAEPAKRRTAVEQSAALFVEAMTAGELPA